MVSLDHVDMRVVITNHKQCKKCWKVAQCILHLLL